MDYNDNDYEGNNLHLSGEESSKISSVLRPFALPKFEFDDNLHGHLRFDSLVENEVFLGIPNQEDNQWIEDYSRGGNGIEFSTSAAESCALPRHVNVWSEATSSESVEMLLKAVGQEEMVQGENIEESVPGNQLAGSTEKMECNLSQDDMIEDIDHQISSLLPTEVEETISRSNQSAGLEVAHTGYIHVLETKLSSYDVCVDNKGTNLAITTENLNVDMKEVSDEPGGTSDIVNESNQVQGNLPLLEAEVNFTESSSQNNDVSVRQFLDQDKISDIGFVSPSSIAEGISNLVKEQEEGCKENDEVLKGVAVETDDVVSHFPCENPSKVDSPKEEYAVKICVTNLGEVSDVPGKESPVSSDVFNEVALVNEPADSSQQRTVILSACSETKHLHDVCSMLHERSSVSIEGEGGDKGLAINGSDVVTPGVDVKTDLSHSIFQPSDQHISLGGNEDSCRGSHCSLEAPHSTDDSSVLHEVLGNPFVVDGERNAHPRDPGNLSDSMVAIKCCEEKSVIDDNDRHSSVSQKEIAAQAEHVPSPLTVGSLQTYEENNTSMQLDAQEHDVFTHEIKQKTSPLDPSGIGHDEKEKGSAISGGDNAVITAGSQPNSSEGEYPALEAEGKNVKSTSSCIKGSDLFDCRVRNSPSHDQGCVDQSEETEADVLKQPSTSVSEQTLKSPETVCAVEIEKELDSAVETRMSGESVSVVATSSVAVSHDGRMELNKIGKVSAENLMVQDTSVAAPIEIPIEAEKEKNQVPNSTFSVVSCTAEIDRSNKAGGPGASSSDFSQNDINTVASLERINAKSSGKVPKKSKPSGVTGKSKEEGTFTFEIRPPGGHATASSSVGLQSFPRIQACKLASVGEGPPSSGSNQTDAVITIDVCPPSGGPTERKARRGSSKSGRPNVKRGNQVKETTPLRPTEKGSKSSQLLSPLGAGQLMAFESVLKPRGAVSIPSCTLPDLNTSTPSSAFFQQPFTDLQQVQLRAQIFVYGSLIQGVAPDEACMVSAFGTSDGSRSSWEPSWRACIERIQSQKSQGNNSETPLPSRPGVKALDQTNRQSSHENEAVSSVTSRAATKANSSPVVNPMMPLSSPLWSMATPSSEALPLASITKSSSFDYPAVSPLNPGQIPHIRNYIAHSSGPLQASFPVPWLASSLSSPFDSSTSYPALTIMEPLKLTPAKETPLPVALGTKHISPIPVTLTAATTVFAGTPSFDSKKMKASPGQTPDTKSRKRKKTSGADVLQIPPTAPLVDTQPAPLVANQIPIKAPAVEGLNQISLIGRNQADLMPKPPVDYTASVAVATPSSLVSKNTTNQLFPVVPPSITTDRVNRGDLSIDKMTLNIEGVSKVKEARSQAEEAAAHATAAINHCEGMWSQLDRQKNSGLTSETEYKLASAAVAIAAAASVAKAAAAAAKIASSAALEAKKMADEAMTKSGTLSTTDHNAILVSNVMKLANATPLSILQGGSWNNTSSLVISAAKDAAKKRIEDAAAATRHAENLDAIVKAAELAAEAVSHAGKIVTMGHPFSLSELTLAGPNNYWKGLQVADTPGSKAEDLNKNKSINSNAVEASNIYVSNHAKANVDMHVTSHVVSPMPPRTLEPDHVTVEDNLMASVKKVGKSSKPQKDKNASNGSKIAGSVSDPGVVSSIKEGSYVEVLKNRGDSKAWFTATVLSMKDLEALVCYTELKSDEGPELLKEWISLEAKDGNALKVRIPHPMTAAQSEGTRKRRRSAVKDYTWSAGDRVDAWVHDCWCEGIVAEKSTKDPTALSIQFPDLRETLTVKLWHLRPTLIWSDGQWTEWRRPGQDGTSQGDTPDEKRAKLGGTSIESKGEAAMAKTLVFGETEKRENTKLPLSANEKTFNIGSTRAHDKPKTGRGKRSGSEKEASGVVFGRPDLDGKRMKFINVSKHYGSEGTSKANVPSDSTRLAKFMNPKGSRSWGTKTKSKADAKDKQVAGSKTRAPKSGKPPSIPSRSVPKKDGLTNSQLTEHDATASDQALLGSDENESGGPNTNEFESFSNVEEISEASSQDIPPENPKKGATRNARSERGNLGKAASTSEESAKEEAHEPSMSEVAERRRSHRRIQPTSRLLEGLQSSMIIPKFPSTSHDKGPRSHKKRPSPKE